MGNRYGRRKYRIVVSYADAGRTTRYRHILKISNRSTYAAVQGLAQLRALYVERFSRVFRSITSDNGNKFATLPETPICYTHPYSSYERGLNEKQNFLIRSVLFDIAI